MLLRNIPGVTRWLARRISGISKGDWDRLIKSVRVANEDHRDNFDKRRAVLDFLKTSAPVAAAWALNLTLELAVAYAKKKKLID